MKLRHKICKIVGKILFDYKKRQDLELAKMKRIIFLQHTNKIGDLLVNTHVFREIKEKYPNIIIDVLGGKSNVDIIKENPYINEVFIYENIFSVLKISKNEYDVCYYHVEESYRIRDYLLLKMLNSKVNIARNKSEFKLIDVSIDGDFSYKREIDKYNALLEIFNIAPKEEKYEIFLNGVEIKNGEKVIEKSKINVVFNRYGANKRRTFNDKNTFEIIKIILENKKNINLILLGHKSKQQEWKKLLTGMKDNRVKIPVISSIRESASIIYNADLIITPETSIVHIACAFRKPQIAIYRKTDELWKPITDESTVIFSKNKKKKDVNYISLEEFKNAFLEKIEKI